MEQQNTGTNKLPEATLLLLAILWGSSFLMAHIALDSGCSPMLVLMCRFIFSTVFVGVVFFKRLRQTFRRKHIKNGLLLGGLFFLTYYTNTMGLKYSSPSNNAFITAAYVAIVPFIWWFVGKVRPLGVMFVSCGLSLLGITFISLDFSAGGALYPLGDSLSLLSSVIAAAHIVAIGEFARRMDHILLVFLQFAVGAVLATAFFFLADRDFASFSNTRGMLAILYLSIVCTSVCFLLQAWAMSRVNPARSAVILSTEALFGALISILAGVDRLTWRLIAGGLIIFFAIILPEIRYWTRIKANVQE